MEQTYSKGKIAASIFALGLAGGSIFIIPYIKYVFYDLQIQVTGMSNTQSALLLTAYSLAIFVVSVPGAFIVDRLDSKKAVQLGLIATTVLTLLYIFVYKSYILSLILWVLLSFVTMGIYWPGFSKILNVVGAKTDKTGSGKSGMTFGFYYACNGISAAIINGLALWTTTRFDDPDTGFKAAIIVIAASTAIATLVVQFCMDKDLVALNEEVSDSGETVEKTTIKDIPELLKNKMVLMILLLCPICYALYTLQSYFTPYLTAVVGISPEESGIFAIIRTYVFFALAPLGGILADRVFHSTARWIGVAFGFLAVIVASFLFMPPGVPVLFISFYTLLPSAFVQMTYTIRYSCLNEVNIPLNRIATVTSFGSIVGSMAEVVIAPFISWLMDTQGNFAYTVLFAILTVLLVIGCFAGLTIAKNNKKVSKTA
ncbi:MAG: MFS transporter [Clostridiales bacterium]|nr:MFS transporter [Clostridiales bacterium]